jgi:hypothetical protein
MVAQRGRKCGEVVKVTDVERRGNVRVVGCCRVTGVYFPPMAIFRKERILECYKRDLPPGSAMRMTEVCCIYEDVFLEYLQHYQKHRTSGKYLFTSDG